MGVALVFLALGTPDRPASHPRNFMIDPVSLFPKVHDGFSSFFVVFPALRK